MEACIPALRAYAYALMRNRQDADNLVHDCIGRALNAGGVQVTPSGIVEGRDATQRNLEKRFKPNLHDLSTENKIILSSDNRVWKAAKWNMKIGDRGGRDALQQFSGVGDDRYIHHIGIHRVRSRFTARLCDNMDDSRMSGRRRGQAAGGQVRNVSALKLLGGTSILRVSLCTAAVLVSMFLLAPRSAAQETAVDPLHACDRAAAKAEHDWNLPEGLLAAIGLIESGRADPGSARLLIWPWSINAGGAGFYASSQSVGIGAVRAFLSRGVQMIDVGCFQVDLFFHPGAFPTLEAAFDPEANAQAAAGILSRARLATTGWEAAVARYHSASPLRGASYAQRVLAILPQARRRIAGLPIENPELPSYAALLSPQARLVRVLAAATVVRPEAPTSPPIPIPALLRRLPRLSGPQVIVLKPIANLPLVLIPNDHSRHRRSVTRRL